MAKPIVEFFWLPYLQDGALIYTLAFLSFYLYGDFERRDGVARKREKTQERVGF